MGPWAPSQHVGFSTPPQAVGLPTGSPHTGNEAPLAPPQSAVPPPVDTQPSAPSAQNAPTRKNLRCPQCGSANVRRLRIVYESGTVRTSGFVSGGYIGDGGFYGTYTGSVSGKQQSLLAKKCAPPRKRQGGGIFLTLVILAIMLGACILLNVEKSPGDEVPVPCLVFLAGLMAAVGVVWSVKDYLWNRNEFPRLRDSWERSFLCFRCGAIFRAR